MPRLDYPAVLPDCVHQRAQGVPLGVRAFQRDARRAQGGDKLAQIVGSSHGRGVVLLLLALAYDVFVAPRVTPTGLVSRVQNCLPSRYQARSNSLSPHLR